MQIYAYVFIICSSIHAIFIYFCKDLVLQIYCSKSKQVIVCSKQEDVGGSSKREGQRKRAKTEKLKLYIQHASMWILIEEEVRLVVDWGVSAFKLCHLFNLSNKHEQKKDADRWLFPCNQLLVEFQRCGILQFLCCHGALAYGHLIGLSERILLHYVSPCLFLLCVRACNCVCSALRLTE